jgi:hypothetical protein
MKNAPATSGCCAKKPIYQNVLEQSRERVGVAADDLRHVVGAALSRVGFDLDKAEGDAATTRPCSEPGRGRITFRCRRSDRAWYVRVAAIVGADERPNWREQAERPSLTGTRIDVTGFVLRGPPMTLATRRRAPHEAGGAI